MAARRTVSSVLLACVCALLLLPAANGFQSEDTECAFADLAQGAEPHSGSTSELHGVVRENATVRCGRGSRCYGLWEKHPDGDVHLIKQGCWTHIGNEQECHGDRCLVTATPSQIQNGSYRFCCCSHNLCNANFSEAPPTADTPALRLLKAGGGDNRETAHQPLRREETVLIALATVAIAAVVVIVLFLGYRMMKGKKKKHSLSPLDTMEAADMDAAADLDSLKLLELIGRGRYGTVFRGSLSERCVAVKLFSSANRQNYVNERSIYCLPLLHHHHNIARFLAAADRTTADGRPEFLILMEFYPHGCLSHYLTVHTVDWSTCCRMTHGITRGLAFLHSQLSRGDQYKPAVAHRDVTSRNVLVRADLSCVLADFGLSMRLTGSRPCCPGDDDTMAISEVGTVRYMAPEVLGGALNLRDCESALKQVDVYALGLLYWESFRRCSHLFPGEAVPEFQLAFQEELGNHPSFEEMQILVAREKFRPRFPEEWKENNLVLRSLKETMEDCWDQDAEARLTAQCAEERLSELMLLSSHNHRNLSNGCSPPQVGSASSYIAALQVGVVKNLQGESAVVRTTTGGPETVEKNHERQQAQARSSTATVLCSASESAAGGAVSTVPVCLQLTQEDLEATKLDPREVDKNLRESSDENLMELSQKQFGSAEPRPATLLYHQILQPSEVLQGSGSTPRSDLGAAAPGDAPQSIHPFHKQQNLCQRPTSLYLLPKTQDPSSAPRLKLGQIKSNHRQVETGVAKMNAVASAAEPHLVSNNPGVQPMMVVAHGYSAGVPTLVTNAVMGRTNPAGPQVEEDQQVERGQTGPEDVVLLNASPDEHEPLLRSEQPPAESAPPPPPPPRHHHHHEGRGSNSNNNNNRAGPAGGAAPEPGLDSAPDWITDPEVQSSRVCLDPSGLGSAPSLPQEQEPAKTSETRSLPAGPPTEDPPLEPEDQDPETPRPAAAPAEPGAGLDEQTRTLQVHSRPAKAKRPERPCSLDLSSSGVCQDDLSDNSLNASGEKIKRRVKTPYTLKKWRPASWVVSTDSSLDPDLEFDGSGHFLSGPHRAGSARINQSKSSMSVFLVGGGATATTATSEPDGVTCF
ncbi:uncharacterized protein V6R79_023668 [Siganus canaliculatus]